MSKVHLEERSARQYDREKDAGARSQYVSQWQKQRRQQAVDRILQEMHLDDEVPAVRISSSEGRYHEIIHADRRGVVQELRAITPDGTSSRTIISHPKTAIDSCNSPLLATESGDEADSDEFWDACEGQSAREPIDEFIYDRTIPVPSQGPPEAALVEAESRSESDTESSTKAQALFANHDANPTTHQTSHSQTRRRKLRRVGNLDAYSRDLRESVSAQNLSVNPSVTELPSLRSNSAPTSTITESLPPKPPWTFTLYPSPLSPGSFRLLTILPGPDLKNELHCTLQDCKRNCGKLHCSNLPCHKLHCDLSTYESFATAPTYETLSYTWGDPKVQSDVHIVNFNLKIKVTANCTNALFNLRSAFTCRTIWVDAICINQWDPVDKAEQIGIMGQIYHQARKCVAYIGEEDANTRQIFIEIQDEDRLDDVGRTARTGSAELAAFLERPWFHRLWVIQEVLLSKDILLQCGRDCVDWHRFSELYEMLYGMPTKLTISELFHRSIPELKYWYEMQKRMRRPLGSTTAGQDQRCTPHDVSAPVGCLNYAQLFDVMCATQTFGCSNPRDKVFALLSLFSGPVPAELRPDYLSDVETVYRRTSLFMLYMGDEGVLSCAEGIDAEQRVATWAVDWRALQQKSQPITTGAVRDAKYRSAQRVDIFPEHQRWTRVSMNIATIARITLLGPAYSSPNIGLSEAMESRAQWRQLVRSKADPISGRYKGGMASFLPRNVVESAKNTFTGLFDVTKSSEPDPDLVEDGLWILSGRRIFATEINLIGLGPENVEEGDMVCFFGGFKVPIVIRRKAKTRFYEFVGECLLGCWRDAWLPSSHSDEVVLV